MDSQIISAIIGGVFAIVGILLTHLLSRRSQSRSQPTSDSIGRHPHIVEESSSVVRGRPHDDHSDFWTHVERDSARTDAEFSRLRVGLFSLLSGFFLLGFDFLVLVFGKDPILELLPKSWGANAIAIVCVGFLPVLSIYWIWTGISHLKN
jgi:hypothetical protein